MVKHIAAILFIFACTSIAWGVLGSTIFLRTYDSDAALRGRVASLWGAPQIQFPASATFDRYEPRTEEVQEGNKKVTRTTRVRILESLPIESSHLDTALELEHRQKGLLWYSTYKVAFAGDYVFRNDTGDDHDVRFALPLPAEKAKYDDIVFRLDDRPIVFRNNNSSIEANAILPDGKTATLHVSYRSQGLDRWGYAFGDNVAQVRDLALRVRTNFKGVDFPDGTLSPTEKQETPGGWDLNWNYRSLMTGYQVGITMPERLQPGPLAGQISYFAPVSLFFFFFLMFIITTLREIDLHPMNYFFLAAAFFSFHLLLAYLVDHVSIHTAFAVCSVVSVFLVVSYLRLVVGMRFAAVEAGLSQFVYLVLFSYAFFSRGYTGLSITIGSILTLFIVMQMTGRIRWSDKFAARTAPAGAPGRT